MNCLLIYARFPRSFWSFDDLLELTGRRALSPPLGLITIAALLPGRWNLRLSDRNVRDTSETDWEWADLVLVSGMLVQREDLVRVIHEAKKRNIPVAVGGPLASTAPQIVEEADYLVLDEGEITIPHFLAALERHETRGTFRSDGATAPIANTPVPRYELLERDAYHAMSLQFSRGCPFHCEFCNTGVVHGKRPRTKTPTQLCTELEALYNLGWRGNVFLVDDNLIGDRAASGEMLRVLEDWQAERDFPFIFSAEASLDLGHDDKLLQAMVACGFETVALGVETPDESTLDRSGKRQNLHRPMLDSIDRIIRAGLRPLTGFIIGFDDESPGAGRRITQFLEQACIPVATISMLQALPSTSLWDRLEADSRLLDHPGTADQPATLPNFHPTRSIEQIAHEYVTAVYLTYDPALFLERTYRCFRKLGLSAGPSPKRTGLDHGSVRLGARIIWRMGIRHPKRAFWNRLASIWMHNRSQLVRYLLTCAQSHYFAEFRNEVLHQIQRQLNERLIYENAPPEPSALTAALEALREKHARDLERMES